MTFTLSGPKLPCVRNRGDDNFILKSSRRLDGLKLVNVPSAVSDLEEALRKFNYLLALLSEFFYDLDGII